MNKEGAIIIVEDDTDDQELMVHLLLQLGVKNEIVLFPNGLEAYSYFSQNMAEPFLIISDINMPKMNGIQLKEKIHQEPGLNLLTVPFIFMSTSDPGKEDIRSAKKLVQGYFKKPPNLAEYKKIIKDIIDFWSKAIEPYF